MASALMNPQNELAELKRKKELLALKRQKALLSEKRELLKDPEIETDWADNSQEAWTERGQVLPKVAGRLAEFGADIADVPTTAFRRGVEGFQKGDGAVDSIKGMMGGTAEGWWEAMNPFGEEDAGDRARRENLWESEAFQGAAGGLEDAKDPYAKASALALESLAPGSAAKNLTTLGAVGGSALLGEGLLGGQYGADIGGFIGAFLDPTSLAKRNAGKNKNLFKELKDEGVNIDEVRDFIDQTIEKPSVAADNIRKNRAAGIKGTVADLAEDQQLYNIEAAVSPGSKEQAAIKNQRGIRQQQIVDTVSNEFGETLTDPNNPLSPRVIDEAGTQSQAVVQGQLAAAEVAEQARLAEQLRGAPNDPTVQKAQVAATQSQDDLARLTDEAAMRDAEVEAFTNEQVAAQDNQANMLREFEGADEAAIRANESLEAKELAPILAEQNLGRDLPSPALASENAAEAMDNLSGHLRGGEKQLWDEFGDLADPLDGSQWKGEANQWVSENLDRTQAQLLRDEQPRIFKMLDGFEDVGEEGERISRAVKPSEVHAVVRQINSKFRAAKAANDLDESMISLKNLGEHLDSQLETGMQGTAPHIKKAYESAKNATKDRIARTATGRIGKARNANEASTFGDKAVPTGNAGKAAADTLKQALADTTDPVTRQLAEEAVEGVQNFVRSNANNPGTITPAWYKSRAPFIDEFPALRDEVRNIISLQGQAKGAKAATKAATQTQKTARKSLDDATKGQDRALAKTLGGERKARKATQAVDSKAPDVREKAKKAETALQRTRDKLAGESGTRTKDLQNTIKSQNIAKYAKAPKKTVEGILNQKDFSGRDLKALIDEVPDKEGVLRVIGDHLVDKISKWDFDTQKVDSQSYANWNKMKDSLRPTMGNASIDRIDKVVNRSLSEAKQKASSAKFMETALGRLGEATANVGGAGLASLLPSNHVLLYGNRLRAGIKAGLTKPNMDNAAFLERLMADPDKFVEFLMNKDITNREQVGSAMRAFMQQSLESEDGRSDNDAP